MSDLHPPADRRPPDRADVRTEERNPNTMQLHQLSVGALVETIQVEDRVVIRAVEEARPQIVALIQRAEPGFVDGGRLVYLGAGTSGRLGVLDASEAPPTFLTPPERVVGLIAGGDRALRTSSEGLEDDPDGAIPELEALELTPRDTVIGVAAGGSTPYVRGGLRWCRARNDRGRPGCLGLITCTPISDGDVEHIIELNTGPEVLTGSTRMKAGTATKLVLNTISTTLMIRAGRVYENLMVDLRATNDKLTDRAARIITMLTGRSRDDAFTLLDAAGGGVKVAVVMDRRGVDRAAAERLLEEAGGRLDIALHPDA